MEHRSTEALGSGETQPGVGASSETLEVFDSIFYNLRKNSELSPLRDAQKREERQQP